MPLVAWALVPLAGALAGAALVGRPTRVRGTVVGLLLGLGASAGWWWFERPEPVPVESPGRSIAERVTSSTCAECHREQYDTWHRTFHRTMTRDATPETVKGDFNNVVYTYQGLTTRLTREGDEFYMETVDPNWAALRARAGDHPVGLPPPTRIRLKVDRLVGSHWLQECLHRAPNGRYVRLPVLYHLGERRWIHSNGAFLAPDTPDFWAQSRGTTWNNTCLYCHNTEPSKNPVRGSSGAVEGFETTVTELGIACAACHGPGVDHVRKEREAAGGIGDVVHPAHLNVARRDDICARCHGALVPKALAWDRETHRDPFIPGQELTLFNFKFWSEAEQAVLSGRRRASNEPLHPEPTDGRFWGDGTPLTTALEYNGMALSACYQKGQGGLSCLSCHTMHGADPNYLLKPTMATNEACYRCHEDYRGRLAEHTRHPPESAGSLCYNCHMPHQVYSLMTTHRSHRIEIPTVAGSVGTGKPHACNLCHLDKSLSWTRDRLAEWPKHAGVARKLSADEEAISAAVLALAQADARTRVMYAGAFSNPAAWAASGTDWFGPFLTRLMEKERYPAVRYLAHRGLRSAYGDHEAGPFDYLAPPTDRRAQLRSLRAKYDANPVRGSHPGLPFDAKGLPDEAVLDRLLAGRNDPDLTIHE